MARYIEKKQYLLRSSDPNLLENARRTALAFATPYRDKDIAGIIFLGALARDYFDPAADIDIALITKPGAEIQLPLRYQKIDGFEISSLRVRCTPAS